jgi:MFS family permease
MAADVVSGAGAAGLMTSMVTLMAEMTTLEKRAALMGVFGSVFGLASVVGPLIGGAFADSAATWRWCFYINLPFGGIAFVAVMFLVKNSKPKGIKPGDTRNGLFRMLDIDWLGTLLVLGAVTCLTLATVWGPTQGWGSAQVIAVGLFILK